MWLRHRAFLNSTIRQVHEGVRDLTSLCLDRGLGLCDGGGGVLVKHDNGSPLTSTKKNTCAAVPKRPSSRAEAAISGFRLFSYCRGLNNYQYYFGGGSVL